MHTVFLNRPNAPRLAYRAMPGDGPGVLFLCGLKSDMLGTKAEYLAAACAARGQAFTRFDYRGHGESDGVFSASLLSEWLTDALAIFDAVTAGPTVIIGSSLGGWLALLLAERRVERVKGLIGIAAAPDFSRELPPAAPGELVIIPSAYSDEPYRLSPDFIADAEPLCWLSRTHDLECPIHLLHGKRDADVPWKTAENIRASVPSADCAITFIADGDHRLSRPQDLARIDKAVQELSC